MPKFIVTTGGVLSGLGKGIVSASVGRLLATKNKVISIKCDGYLNIDPGTMNPFEHGEVFVLDDGGEVDLDFGHYERFLNTDCKFSWNLTSGKIFQMVIEKERRGDYLGKTVQMIPHVTDAIKQRFFEIAEQEKADVVLIEMGGTVGDIEMMLFNEAARQLRSEVGRDNILYIHVTYLPELDCVGEQKTKPTQQSVQKLREIGIQPDIIVGRTPRTLDEESRKKIALFCNVDPENVISDPDFDQVYELPLIFKQEKVDKILQERLSLQTTGLSNWEKLVKTIKGSSKKVTIAICGKYTKLHDSYISIMEALKHAGAHLDTTVELKWIETTEIEEGKVPVEKALQGIDGVIVPGGFGSRGSEGKIKVIQYIREKNIPFLGICLGLQIAVIEFARNVCGLEKANSTEFDPDTNHPVVDILPEQKEVTEKGGTMRLGGHDVKIKPKTRAHELFGDSTIRRRFRHRYEVNPEYIQTIQKKGLVFSGMTPEEKIMQVIELPGHPFFMGAQFHPELTSRLEDPSPMFYGLVEAALQRAEEPDELIAPKLRNRPVQ
ncbi:MAG: glutamine hydrolyzing CTP synthase [Candidatus Woesearchaeota archaeon]